MVVNLFYRADADQDLQTASQKLSDSENTCPFCPVTTDRIVATHNSFVIVRNSYPYAAWENNEVVEHLMLVPVRHTASLLELYDAELSEWADLTRQAETLGHNIYHRSWSNANRSVGHQHTHLLKLGGKIPVPELARRFHSWAGAGAR